MTQVEIDFYNGHYNTTNETGEKLKRSNMKAGCQEEKIMNHFRLHPLYKFTPCDINSVVLSKCPLTSVRRAMTNLSNKGLLIKTNEKRMGRYGKLNHVWRLG